MEGEILKMDASFVWVEVGLKFPIVMKRDDVPVPSSILISGTRIVVRLRDPELTAHFLGDSK